MCSSDIRKNIRVCNSISSRKRLAGFLINYSFAVSLIILKLIVALRFILYIRIRSFLSGSRTLKGRSRVLQVLYDIRPLSSSKYLLKSPAAGNSSVEFSFNLSRLVLNSRFSYKGWWRCKEPCSKGPCICGIDINILLKIAKNTIAGGINSIKSR